MKTLISSVAVMFIAVTLHAQKNVDSLKALLNKQKTDTDKIKLLVDIGGSFGYGFTKNDSVLWYLNEALDLSKKSNYQIGEMEAREEMGRYYYTSGDFKEALKLLLQNLKETEALHDTIGIYFTIKDLMKAYRNMGDWNQELFYAKKGKELLFSGYFKDSIQFYDLSTVYFNHMATVYSGLGKQDSALYYMKRSYQDFLKTNDASGMAVGAGNLGDSYAAINKSDSAFYYYKESLAYAIESKRFDVAAGDYIGIASIFKEKNQADSAFFYGRKAFVMFKEMNDPNVMGVSSFLSELYKDKGQYDSAYKYLQEYITLNDSLNNQSNIIQAQNVSFNEKLQHQQLEQVTKEAQQQLKNRIKFYVLAAALIIFSFIAFVLYRNVKNKRKANLLLSKQKEEIESALSELKSTQSQLIQQEKMASLGELTAGIAHEIQNPLNFVNNFSEVNSELVDELEQEANKGNLEEVKAIAKDIKENEEKIIHHGKRADVIVKGMLQHSRSSSGKKEPTDINALCDEYLRLSFHGLRAKDKSFNAKFETAFNESIGKISVVPQDIGRVVLNLINNAFYAVSEKAKQNISGYEPIVIVSTKKINEKIEICVKDNGNGIPQKVLDKIFQPFFTTKPTGQGTGLGLSLSYDIVKAHGGEIRVETKENKGTEFIIQLPNQLA